MEIKTEQSIRYKDNIGELNIKQYNENRGIKFKTNTDKLKNNSKFAKSGEERKYNYQSKISNLSNRNIKTEEQKYTAKILGNQINNDNVNNTSNNIILPKNDINNSKNTNTNEKELAEETNKTDKTSSKQKGKDNRGYLSKKISKNINRQIDGFLMAETGDLGIDTVKKSILGAKKIKYVGSKTMVLSQSVGQTTFNVITSDTSKKVVLNAINLSKSTYRNSKAVINKIYERNKNIATKKTESILRKEQKSNIRKKAIQKAREKASQMKIAFKKGKDIITSILTKKMAMTFIIMLMLILAIVSVIVAITSIFSYSVHLVLDDNINMIYEYVSELDSDINQKIDTAETTYPNIDKFVYNVPKRADTNQEQVYAFIKAKYGDEKLLEDVLKAEIRQIHNQLYTLRFTETSETINAFDENGKETQKTIYIMHIELSSKEFNDYYQENKDKLLSETQQKNYEIILKEMKENVGKILQNPFPNTDWKKYVTSEYGYRIHPIYHTYTKHTGLDIGMPQGTEIHSCMSGTVTVKNSGTTGLGLHVIVTNGKYTTYYGHCSKVLVQTGDKVNAGDVIALVGSTGASTGAHLHLEYLVNSKNKNPRIYLEN